MTKNNHAPGKKMSSAGSFSTGFFMPFKTINYVREQNGLKRFFIIPFLLNIIILSAVFYFSYSFLAPWLNSFAAGDEWYMSVARFLISPVVIFLLVVITVIIYSFIGNIITAPFNEYISEKIELLETGSTGWTGKSPGAAASAKNAALNAAKIILLLAAVNLLLLLLNLLPVIGSIVYAVSSFLANSFFLGLQFFDYPLERRGLSFKEKIRKGRAYFLLVAGLGTGFLLMTYIPIAGFLSLNLAAAGASRLYIDQMKE